VHLENSAIDDFEISLRDMQGKVLIKDMISAGETLELKRNRLPSGMYVIVVKSSENVFTTKLIFK